MAQKLPAAPYAGARIDMTTLIEKWMRREMKGLPLKTE
jgi:hypothetical protein